MELLNYDLDNMIFNVLKTDDDDLKKMREENIEYILKNEKEVKIIASTNSINDIDKKITDLNKQFQNQENIKIELNLNLNKEYIYEETEMQELQNINSICEKNNFSLYINLNNGEGKYQNFLIARNEIENLK